MLLPWEIGFVTWQLTEVPLKRLTLNELKKQVDELATKYDENPKLFLANAPKPSGRYDSKGRPVPSSQPFEFKSPVVATIGGMDTQIQGLLGKLDEEAIQETFASLLGYYIAKSPELRMHDKGAIVQGIKDWSVQALGLPVPPYVSDSFLLKLGVSDGRTKHFGRQMRPSMYTQRDVGAPSWQGRGQQRLRNRAREVPSWATDLNSDDEEDPVGVASDYRGHRYGKGPGKEARNAARDEDDDDEYESPVRRRVQDFRPQGGAFGRAVGRHGKDWFSGGGRDNERRGGGGGRSFGREDHGGRGYGLRKR